MADSADLRYKQRFNIYELYTRTRSRTTENYKELVERINRKPKVIYPDGWYDWDIDRVIAGKGCVHHGFLETKYIKHQIKKPFRFPHYTRKLVTNALANDDMKIEYNTLHFSFHDRIGVYSENDEYGVYPISSDRYNNLLKAKREIDKENGNLGKGLFLFLFYTPKLEYFSVINFTNSKYILGEDPTLKKYQRWNDRVKYYLNVASEILEPTFNELLLFMLEAYIRWDFYTLYSYLTDGGDKLIIDDDEKILADGFGAMKKILNLWMAFKDAMEWLLESIHFDTIVEEAKGKTLTTNNPSYKNLITLTQNGEIFNYMERMIRKKYKVYNS